MKAYFYSGFVAYILGLGTTIAVMHIFKAAQPALLYLVPTCLGLPLLLALLRGDIPDLIKFVSASSPSLRSLSFLIPMLACCPSLSRYRDYPEAKKGDSNSDKEVKEVKEVKAD